MNHLESLIAIAKTFVIDLEGTLVDGMPYQELLKDIAPVAGVSYDQLYDRYMNQWQGLDEAEAHHASLCAGHQTRLVRALYRQFKEAKEHVEPLPHTIDILVRLHQANARLLCWTRGEERLQRVAVRRSGLEQFFDRVVVVPVKTRETIRDQLLPAVNGEPFILIGDSYDQDIVPAEGLATKRVWVFQSKSNIYRTTDAERAPDLLAVPSFADLLKPAK